MKKNQFKKSVQILGLLLLLTGCSENYIPKPRGYFRIALPPNTYKTLDTTYACRFPYNKAAIINITKPDSGWLDVVYPRLKAVLHCTYKSINHAYHLRKLIDDSQEFVYKHTVKASAIDEQLFTDTVHRVYGLLFDIKGNAASNEQFYVTDSVKHFLRVSLYFDVKPNYDSLKPVIDYIRKDMVMMIDSLEWKQN